MQTEACPFEAHHDKTNTMTCAQRRLRSAWASAQSDQSSLCAQWTAKDSRFLQTGKSLTRLGGSESSLGAQVILLVLSFGDSFIKITYLDDMGKIFSSDIVVCLDKYFSQSTLPYWIVFGIKLIKSVKCITILKKKRLDGL